MTLQDEADEWADRYLEQRALRPTKFKCERPRCRLCAGGLQEADAGEFECEPCREKASRKVMRAEAMRRFRNEPLVIDW